MVQRIVFYFQISFFYPQGLPMSKAWTRMVTLKHYVPFFMTWSLAWLVERSGLYVKRRNQVDFRGKEGCICAGWSIYHLSIDELLGEVDWQLNGKMD
jgi:hypothetical protein